jgi:hypothetical protein
MLAVALAVAASQPATPPAITRFAEAGSTDSTQSRTALAAIARSWKDEYAAMMLDVIRLFPSDPGTKGGAVRQRLFDFLEQQTGQRLGPNIDRWRAWSWTLPYAPHPDYALFKGQIFGNIDPRMRAFFPPGVVSTIRLDEIEWGGVRVNGIPPLRYPKTIGRAATYLGDSNLVFGMVVNGEARAYPKRILAWHEMAIDRLGGVELTIVYCTLCGTVIPFDSVAGGRQFRFGTSGLLYRSNKLMFDEDSNSLWSTFAGVAVVGSLVNSGIRLQSRPVVTTTWREWRSAHPDTSVLSLDTGHTRDYSEGAAYREYFATDRLMFPTSKTDRRLPNKAEVLVMQLDDPRSPSARVPVAIHADVLARRPVYSFTAANQTLVVVTTDGGANRVYRALQPFPEQRAQSPIVSTDGARWLVTETGLVKQGDASTVLPRVSAQRAFWFGWFAQYPDTLLIK